MALVGRIARAHGLRGQVIVNLDTDFPETRFQPGAELFIEGVTTIDDAEALAGSELRVPADRLFPLPAGSFYRHDLVGCRVETRDGQAVGTVSGVEGTM